MQLKAEQMISSIENSTELAKVLQRRCWRLSQTLSTMLMTQLIKLSFAMKFVYCHSTSADQQYEALRGSRFILSIHSISTQAIQARVFLFVYVGAQHVQIFELRRISFLIEFYDKKTCVLLTKGHRETRLFLILRKYLP